MCHTMNKILATIAWLGLRGITSAVAGQLAALVVLQQILEDHADVAADGVVPSGRRKHPASLGRQG